MIILTHIFVVKVLLNFEVWNRNFSKSIDKEISINGLNDNLSRPIANAFAN